MFCHEVSLTVFGFEPLYHLLKQYKIFRNCLKLLCTNSGSLKQSVKYCSLGVITKKKLREKQTPPPLSPKIMLNFLTVT